MITNTPTADPFAAAAQAAAQAAGYHLSGPEITLIIGATSTIVGGLVHYAHLVVYAFGRAGGLQGIKKFIQTGSH